MSGTCQSNYNTIILILIVYFRRVWFCYSILKLDIRIPKLS